MSSPSVMAVGARAPAGLTALQLAMAVRACAVAPLPTTLRDKRGQPVGLATVGGLGAELHGYDRMVQLAAPALREASASLERTESPALVLAVPEPGRPDDDPRFDGAMPADVACRAGVAIDLDRSRVVRAGHAGVALAAAQALELLGAGAPSVIVGGVDSFCHPDVVRWLDEGCRLHATGVENGLVPSEAAAFFVLRAASPRPTAPLAPLPRLTHASAQLEQAVPAAEPNLAVAATALARAMVEATGRCPWVLCDVNGERHRVREWQMLSFRELWADDVVELRLPDRLGDVGAASGAVALAIAVGFWQAGCAPATSCAIMLAADGAERGVLRLEQGS